MSKPISQLERDLNRLKNEIQRFPKKAAYIVSDYTHAAFRDGKWDGQKWTDRKSSDRSDRRNPDKPRRLMTKTRTLERSVMVKNTSDSVIVSTNVKYAQIHNEGGTINHPGGTPYLPFNVVYTARKTRGRIGRMGDNQVAFISKRNASKFPQAKFTKPHKIPMPKRQFMGYSRELMNNLKKNLDSLIEASKKH